MFYSVETLKQNFVCSSSCLAWAQFCFSDRCVGPGRHSAVLFTLGGGDQDTACALPSDHRPREVCTGQRLPHHQRFPRQAREGFRGSSSQGVYGCVLKNYRFYYLILHSAEGSNILLGVIMCEATGRKILWKKKIVCLLYVCWVCLNLALTRHNRK